MFLSPMDLSGGGPPAAIPNAPGSGKPAPALPCRSFQEKRPIVNEDEPRMNTKRHEDRWTPPSTTSGAKMFLQFCALGVAMSWDDGFLGARASRPHKAWHSLGHLPHLDQPGTAPWLSFGLADGVPAHRVAACSIARKLSGGQRDRMRAGRPRSQPGLSCSAIPVNPFVNGRATDTKLSGDSGYGSALLKHSFGHQGSTSGAGSCILMKVHAG